MRLRLSISIYALTLILIVSLQFLSKYHLSPDYTNYLRMFNQAQTIDSVINVYHYGFIFSLLQYSLNLFNISIYWLYKLISLGLFFSYSLLAHSLLRGHKEYLFLALIAIIYVFSPAYIFFSNNVIRQGLASIFLMLGVYSYITKGKTTKVEVWYYFLSVLTHLSAFIIVPAILVAKIKNKNYRVYIFSILLVSIIFGYFLGNDLILLLGKSQVASNSYVNILVTLKLLLFPALLTVVYAYRSRLSSDIVFLYSLNFWIVCFALSLSWNYLVVSRIFYYLEPFFIILFFSTLKSILNKRTFNITIVVAIITVFALLFSPSISIYY